MVAFRKAGRRQDGLVLPTTRGRARAQKNQSLWRIVNDGGELRPEWLAVDSPAPKCVAELIICLGSVLSYVIDSVASLFA